MRHFLLALLLAALFASPSAVSADIAPPAQPPGTNLQPGDAETQVRMLGEKVLIEVLASAPAGSLGRAHVTADFTMQNLGPLAESMAARFPIGASDGFYNILELEDLQVKVNGSSVSTRRISGEDPNGMSETVPWAEFDVIFPPGQDVQIQVRYSLEASGEYPFVWFNYILATGAGWKGTIGSGDIVVRLPYEANEQNTLFSADEGYIGTPRDALVDGNEIRWHFEDLEPSISDNFEVELVMPSAWEQALTEQNNVRQKPNDGEAWGRLGKLYKEMTFSSRRKGFRMDTVSPDPGAAALYQLSLRAYEQAVTLKPDDALWHAGFADLLTYHAYFVAFDAQGPSDEAMRGLREIHTALELAPDDPIVQQIAEDITYYMPKGIQRNGSAFDFPWLTATPGPPAGSVAAVTATQTGPAQPPADPQMSPVTATPEAAAPPPSLPGCASAVFLPLIALWIARASFEDLPAGARKKNAATPKIPSP